MLRHRWYRQGIALAAVLALPAVASAQGIAANHVPLSTTLGDIAKLRSAYVEAFNAKDAAALGAMFTLDATMIQADGSTLNGSRAITKMFTDSAATFPHAVVASESVRVYGTTAVDVGTWTVHPKAGGEMVSHYLVVLRHGIHGWKVQNVADVPAGK